VAMNMSPWRCDARAVLDVPQVTTLKRLVSPTMDASAAQPLTLSAGRQSWPLSLAPYEIRAVRTSSPGVKVVEVQADVDGAANAELSAELSDLTNRDLTAPRAYDALPDSSFENSTHDGQLAAWHLTDNSGLASAEPDAVNPQDGKTSLHFRRDAPPLSAPGSIDTQDTQNGQPPPVVDSDPFPVPPTGQLAMTVFARGKNLGSTTELRLVFKSEVDGRPYRRAASVSATKLERDGQWGFFAIYVNDLPLDSNGKMRIAFELTGPGEVWLDNVKLYDLLFPLTFYGDAQAEILQLSKQIHAAKSAFDARQITDCLQILDGYWPRFILAYRPVVQPQVAIRPASPPASPSMSDERQESPPGIGDRLKRYVPIWR
ncbi:MAG TPA: hypothetical protein VHE81_21625, partial [Lacipirellulaceae bacterium]|nr:hypothetical protein [Lacipirellulaceae bacterium]